MAVGATIVIISGGIDLSVGSVYALAGVAMALVLRVVGPPAPVGDGRCSASASAVASGSSAARSTALMVVGLRVHPFIITLGTMWILRGIAFVTSNAESILLPRVADRRSPRRRSASARRSIRCRCSRCSRSRVVGAVYLTRTVMGRHVFAVGGNAEASRFSGLRLGADPDRRVRDRPG